MHPLLPQSLRLAIPGLPAVPASFMFAVELPLVSFLIPVISTGSTLDLTPLFAWDRPFAAGHHSVARCPSQLPAGRIASRVDWSYRSQSAPPSPPSPATARTPGPSIHTDPTPTLAQDPPDLADILEELPFLYFRRHRHAGRDFAVGGEAIAAGMVLESSRARG